jgi:hypothetical protein
MPKKNVFDNDLVESLAVQFKRTGDIKTYQKICEGSNNLIDAIIRSNKYHQQVPFDDLKNNLFLQLHKWILGWSPGKGKLYTYFTSCTKHGCKTYLAKESALHKRLAYTDVCLEAFEKDPTFIEGNDRFIEVLKSALEEIYLRWSEPYVREIIKYCVGTIIRKHGDRRQQILRTIVLAWDVSHDTAKFLLDWSHGAVRQALLDHYAVPLGGVDILRVSEKYSFIPDLVNVLGLEKAKKLLHIFAGISIRFPTMKQLRKQMNMATVYEELSEDNTPDKVYELSKRYRMSPAKVEEAFDLVAENIRQGLLEDYPLYAKEEEMPYMEF